MKLKLGSFLLSLFIPVLAQADQSFQVSGKLINVDGRAAIKADGELLPLDNVGPEVAACDAGVYEIVSASAIPNGRYILLDVDCTQPRDRSLCALFVMAQPMYDAETGDCALAGDGCAASDLAELGYRSPEAGECAAAN
jgi:hypothetical protein